MNCSLRKLRDDAILADPIARDFFHVFWSRYYEWSPGVARIASQDGAVRRVFVGRSWIMACVDGIRYFGWTQRR